jgi:hypothetical protein
MQYSIRIDKKALEYLSSLPQNIKRQIGRKIERLKTDPCPPTCRLCHQMSRIWGIFGFIAAGIYGIILLYFIEQCKQIGRFENG